jgi:hypothetical protein
LGAPRSSRKPRKLSFHRTQLSLELATEIVLLLGMTVGMSWLSLDSFQRRGFRLHLRKSFLLQR